MNTLLFSPRLRTTLGLFAILACSAPVAQAASPLSQRINPPEVGIGDQVEVTFTIQNNTNIRIPFPRVDGLQVAGSGTSTQVTFTNGALASSTSQTFIVIPTKAGDITIPTFDIPLQNGQVLHTQPMKLHVLTGGLFANGGQPSNSPNPSTQGGFPTPFNPTGPVTMPGKITSQPNTQPQSNAPDANTTSNIPTDADGNPLKVFMVVTPKTTEGYVGETIPVKIEFYIRLDVLAQQDSLPTIKGSDFLMNNLSVHPGEDEVEVLSQGYHRETWVTAISAPKSGDFPFQMVRATYWTKPSSFSNPFSNFFRQSGNLEHREIASNPLTFHIHTLPDEGRPANFSGAIGQMQATGNATPASVEVGQPVTLHFTVSGEGNFDYVKCPTIASDSTWKTYIPSSKTEYQDESRTQGTKTFEQAIIPQKPGTFQLPPASFSYFDPNTKKYVSLPVTLPAIVVSGTATPAATPMATTDDGTSTGVDPAAPKVAGYLPNRLDLGSLSANLTPIYRQPWVWIAQGVLLLAVLLGLVISYSRSRTLAQVDRREAEALRRQGVHREEDAMAEAVRNNDARAFFLSARHALQLQLGSQWGLNPEAITLAEIRHRDPERAAALEPLFKQADEVIYSGGHGPRPDLAQWEVQVRQELSQLQAVTT